MTTVREIRRNTRPAVVTWVPVTDAHGVVRMQMRWHVGDQPARSGRPAA